MTSHDERLLQPRPVERKTILQTTAEWDAIAVRRGQQLRGGLDTSYTQVLMPAVVDMLNTFNATGPVIDVGCGAGVLTQRLASDFSLVTGVSKCKEYFDCRIDYAEFATHANHLRAQYCGRIQYW